MPAPLIEIHDFWRKRAENFARDVVEGYRAGRKDFSRRLTVPGRPAIWGNAGVQYCGRLGEIAWCLYLGEDPDTALSWDEWCDHGADFTIGDFAIDVKATNHEYGNKLIWPVSKNDLWNAKAFNALAMARVEKGDDVRLLGAVSKRRFAEECSVSDGSDRLVKGTRYMHERSLCPAPKFKVLIDAQKAKNSRDVRTATDRAGPA